MFDFTQMIMTGQLQRPSENLLWKKRREKKNRGNFNTF